MPVDEENKELRDLVAETLKAKGVLGKVQAEIRASVFLALEEQDVFKDKSPFLNKPLKEFLKTSDGLTVLSLVKEFLEFFNLEFTSMVFDPETHAGIDYTYEGRSKLANDLSLEPPSDKPLLAHVLSQLKPNNHLNSSDSNHLGVRSFKDDALIALSPEHSNLSNGVNGDAAHVKDRKERKVEPPQSHGDGAKMSSNRHEVKDKPKAEESLTSLSNFPPLNNKLMSFTSHKANDVKSLIDLGLNSKLDPSMTESDKQTKSSSKSESEESEIEEDIASHNSNLSGVTAVSDDNTMDVSVSKASGHGDYLEEV